jgi:16S rRNA C1402 N4-methylase RsmH
MSRDACPSILDQCRSVLRRVLQEGDLAIDATVGNGHDTAFLAECVGATGKVVGFDLQEAAIANTRGRLDEQGFGDRVLLLQRGHETMVEALAENSIREKPRAVVFNLGYLPGGDHSLITRPETTLRALESALALLRPGGVIAVVAYPGHQGGSLEAESVLAWARKIPPAFAKASSYQFLNTARPAPFLISIMVENIPQPNE